MNTLDVRPNVEFHAVQRWLKYTCVKHDSRHARDGGRWLYSPISWYQGALRSIIIARRKRYRGWRGNEFRVVTLESGFIGANASAGG
eukprot:1146279-Pelagomonas_calceolata.AAC.17